MRGRLSDPSWKSGPTYPEPTDSEHAIDPEPAGYDHDGVGRDEAERVDGEALCAVREAYSCSRDGCDADPRRAHVYALSDVSRRVQQAAAHAIDSRGSGTTRNRASLAEGNEADYTEEPTAEDLIEYLAVHAVIVDYDEGPILGFEFGDDEFGYVYPHFTDESGFGGPCYGHVEPEPDINAHRYDL
mgnify:CR=1 FL=1